ncbi:hypothetical protein Pse7367_0237 [Thalassoporum mexicanum PCC 7367]|uniref:KTSC domain-containing protein n=1 Tax=Thalassoporum mexicanum TaxID=3457544 RepID=UPI00029FCE1E|nr:hypothetical protein Pse7367_0237 [Pseudanabaena sp. PCC 7367]
MERKSVSSSNLASVGYAPDTQILEVEFMNGGLYQYSSVPQSVYAGLMSASSHGSYFNQYVRNVYSYQKIR